MDIIYRGNLQNLAVSKGVVELPHISTFLLDKSVLSESTVLQTAHTYKYILECAVLDSPFVADTKD